MEILIAISLVAIAGSLILSIVHLMGGNISSFRITGVVFLISCAVLAVVALVIIPVGETNIEYNAYSAKSLSKHSSAVVIKKSRCKVNKYTLDDYCYEVYSKAIPADEIDKLKP